MRGRDGLPVRLLSTTGPAERGWRWVLQRQLMALCPFIMIAYPASCAVSPQHVPSPGQAVMCHGTSCKPEY